MEGKTPREREKSHQFFITENVELAPTHIASLIDADGLPVGGFVASCSAESERFVTVDTVGTEALHNICWGCE